MKKECCNINEVVQEFYNYLKSYILSKVNNVTVAEDIVQEVMIKLIESHQKNKEINNIKAWLFQVSRNTIYDYYKKHNMEYNLDNEWHLEAEVDSDLSKILVSDYVIPAIKLLPEKYATPLMLSDIDKISQKDIAKQLHLELSATKMRIQRARTKLRALFVECCHLEYDKQGNFIDCTIKTSCEPLQNIAKELKTKTL
ncbi:sigma-70 family RNA polymerase sigma factor [Psychroserpens damuponensis]|uniref:sigma-70 family RNA polymerase sigma factor n=1 Tax=Psychroserpens damuponensis TaxID=943936 RepID=UPI0006937536|nr:sigma-70 family RNA polymerase sigma factor [Psychroserpens damuponensis]